MRPFGKSDIKTRNEKPHGSKFSCDDSITQFKKVVSSAASLRLIVGVVDSAYNRFE